MATTLQFADLLRLIEERSVALRAEVAAAASLEMQVPTCPEWTLLELVHHLGNSHRRWAATVAAGLADSPPDEAVWKSSPATPSDREALLGWSQESTTQLLSALRAAGPDRSCWTWWGEAQSPSTSGAVARHQLQCSRRDMGRAGIAADMDGAALQRRCELLKRRLSGEAERGRHARRPVDPCDGERPYLIADRSILAGTDEHGRQSEAQRQSLG